MIALSAGCGQTQEKTTDKPVTSQPLSQTVLFENNYVKVDEFMLKPGDKLPLHEGGQRAVYALSDYTIRWTEGDQVTEKTWQKGEAHWHDVIEHAVENIGDTDARYLVVTRKETNLPESGDYMIAQDASQEDKTHSRSVFENEHIRIIEVKLAPGESQSMHHGINRLIYSLTPCAISYTSDQMNAKESTLEAGDIHWHQADKHSVANTGETEAHYLIVEFKH